MGHALSGADMKTLFGIYDRLGMPSEVIMLLINHVADRLRRRYGEGRLPTMHAVQQEAFRWAREEIFTAEQAEEVCAFIRTCLRKLYNEAAAEAVTIQYGGSMNDKNADELLQKVNVDGGLIGGASLVAEKFAAIVKAATVN